LKSDSAFITIGKGPDSLKGHGTLEVAGQRNSLANQ